MRSRFLSLAVLTSLVALAAVPARAQDTTEAPSEPAPAEPAPAEPAPAEPGPADLAPSDAAEPMMMQPEPEPAPIEAPAPIAAVAPREVRPHRFEVDATVATFWDFFISGRGAIALDPLLDLTVHATLWTGEELSPSHSEVWVETGAGARVILLDAALWVGVEAGITHGSYLSDYTEGVPLDGIVARFYGDLRLPLIEHVVGLDAYAMFAIFTALREGSAEAKNAFHTVARAGAILFDVVTAGAYYEHFFRQVRAVPDVHETPALWLGGYVETRFDFGLVLGVSAGIDFTPDVPSDESEFYRAWIGWRG